MKRIYKFVKGVGLVDITEECNRVPESVAPAIFGEIEPYTFMGESHKGNFERITSRTRHREALKEGGYIEVGNQKPANLGEKNV